MKLTVNTLIAGDRKPLLFGYLSLTPNQLAPVC